MWGILHENMNTKTTIRHGCIRQDDMIMCCNEIERGCKIIWCDLRFSLMKAQYKKEI